MSEESVTVSSEKIENGYLIRTSRCGPDGEYTSSTTFSKTKPDIAAGGKPGKEPNPGPSTLANAIGLLK